MSIGALMATLEKLSVPERLELIERLRDALPKSLKQSDVPDWHIELLNERLRDASAGSLFGNCADIRP